VGVRLIAPALLAALAMTACFDPEIQDGVVACGNAGCPDGMTCAADGFCYGDPPPGGGEPGDPDDPDGPVDPPVPACGAAPVDDYCAAVPPLGDTPSIDGVLDCDLTLQAMPRTFWDGEGSAPPATHAARFAVAWHRDGLYVYVEVTDDYVDSARDSEPTYMGDAVELYVDADGQYDAPPAYDDPDTRQFVIAAAEDGVPERRAEIYSDAQWIGNWGGSSYVAVPRTGGYAVEVFVGNADLGFFDHTHAAGHRVGFDLAVNEARDRQGNQDYIGQYFLRIAGGSQPWPWQNVSAFCVPELVAK
jgi:hypothetical protein